MGMRDTNARGYYDERPGKIPVTRQPLEFYTGVVAETMDPTESGIMTVTVKGVGAKSVYYMSPYGTSGDMGMCGMPGVKDKVMVADCKDGTWVYVGTICLPQFVETKLNLTSETATAVRGSIPDPAEIYKYDYKPGKFVIKDPRGDRIHLNYKNSDTADGKKYDLGIFIETAFTKFLHLSDIPDNEWCILSDRSIQHVEPNYLWIDWNDNQISMISTDDMWLQSRRGNISMEILDEVEGEHQGNKCETDIYIANHGAEKIILETKKGETHIISADNIRIRTPKNIYMEAEENFVVKAGNDIKMFAGNESTYTGANEVHVGAGGSISDVDDGKENNWDYEWRDFITGPEGHVTELELLSGNATNFKLGLSQFYATKLDIAQG